MSDLTVEFGNIIETPTVFPEERGLLEVTITNQGNEDVTGANLKLYASTDTVLDDENLNRIDDTLNRPPNDPRPPIPEGIDEGIDALQGTDELLGTISGVNLAAGEEGTFTIDFATDTVTSDIVNFATNTVDLSTASVVSPGAYNLIAEVDANNDSNRSNDRAIQFISSDGTDVILDWNSVFLNAVQAEGKADIAAEVGLEQESNSLEDIRGVAPPVEARDGAILHTAIYDAVFTLSADPRSTGIAELPDTPEGASQEAAVVGASYTVLSELFPEQEATFAEQRDRSLAEISDDSIAEQAGFDFGVGVAEAILQERNDDGASMAQDEYSPETTAGAYKEIREPNPTLPLPNGLDENGLVEVTALLPEWGLVIPFAIDSADDFRASGPPAFTSQNYGEAIEQVRLKGGLVNTVDENGNEITTERTPEETEIAQFWSYDRADTFRPPGQWNQIAQEVAIDQGNSLEDNALLFAELNVAMADAGIVAWDSKYAYEQLRPVTAIRNAANDSNEITIADPNWEPLITTPNFPDYISGHSAFGGAAAGVLEDFFGNDVSFTIPSQELPGVSREFTSMDGLSSFGVAAEENAVSREFGGVHVEISNADGVDVGLNVANFVTNESDLFM